MTNDFNYIFQYLDKEGVYINKAEFEYQIQSHPDYPSFLAVSDTLTFFNIANGVLSVGIAEIELLPDRFVAFLEIEKGQPQFFFIEKKDSTYFYSHNKTATALSLQELERFWKNRVLLIEKSGADADPPATTATNYWVLPGLSVLLLFVLLLQSKAGLNAKLFLALPALGLFFSFAALRDLFSHKSVLLDSFCNMTSAESCEKVTQSAKWKIFETVSFSDLSLIFFSYQFICLLLFLFIENTEAYFETQILLLTIALPVLFISLYYQKFVEKMWCPVCLAIISVILSELGYVWFYYNFDFNVTAQAILISAFVFVTVALIWFSLKKLLRQQKELKEFHIAGNRFKRNYEIFKNNLLASEISANSEIESGSIILGNRDASLKIIVVTSPFCSFCAEVHTVIEEILSKYSDLVSFDLRFNFNEVNSDARSQRVHQKLLSIYYNYGQEAFRDVLHQWFTDFATKDEKIMDRPEIMSRDDRSIQEILKEQFLWNQANDVAYTPSMFINGYVFPKHYERKDLLHFIIDLSEDECFITERIKIQV
ncbi:thioredoxin domain-containing protein [Flavobacterium sp. CLA17]|uniref:thioredoxin domain-containing protein n=1 Tax=Flavobacterium sp. CLA17 TaxID=2724135 RepID=UPI001492E99C|nr:thioredoxin domain-containing protein [Flavobacterium sp. CLA17]QSB29148.1 thioredoxin domain-containing protein [Flavobacterium sp. CLA17]